MGARISLVVRVTDAALRLVAPLTASKETERITKDAESLRALAEGWRQTSPTMDERARILRRVIRLWTAAAWLRRKERAK